MTGNNKFEGILVFDDGPDIYSRNKDGRVLFRFNRIDSSFAVFRSKRMTDEEKEFCVIMLDLLRTHATLMTEHELIKAINYELEKDLYCT